MRKAAAPPRGDPRPCHTEVSGPGGGPLPRPGALGGLLASSLCPRRGLGMQAPQERRRTASKLGCPGSPPGQPESDGHRSGGGSGTCGHGAGGEPGAPPAGSNRPGQGGSPAPGAGRTTWASLTEANAPCAALAPGFPTDRPPRGCVGVAPPLALSLLIISTQTPAGPRGAALERKPPSPPGS